MRYAIIILLAVIYLVFGCPEEVLSYSPAALGAAHHFFHANIFHLAVNCLSVWVLFRPGRGDNLRHLTAAYIIATLSVVAAVRPAVGFSDILFAVMGLRTPSLRSGWWRRREVIIFLAVTIAMAALPQVSATTHIFSFAAGTLLSAITRKIRSISHDYAKSTGHRS